MQVGRKMRRTLMPCLLPLMAPSRLAPLPQQPLQLPLGRLLPRRRPRRERMMREMVGCSVAPLVLIHLSFQVYTALLKTLPLVRHASLHNLAVLLAPNCCWNQEATIVDVAFVDVAAGVPASTYQRVVRMLRPWQQPARS
jgi:hypothetical protein